MLVVLVALVIAYNYACVEGGSLYTSCFSGIWHGLNFPSNYILSLFSDRPLLGNSSSSTYKWSSLIAALLSTWAWVCFMIHSFDYRKSSSRR